MVQDGTISGTSSGQSGQNGKKCPDCGAFRLWKYFRYRCIPMHQAHLNPRIVIGDRCNACRIAWIKQDFKRIRNACVDQVISSFEAELWTKQLKDRMHETKTKAMQKVWRTARFKETREAHITNPVARAEEREARYARRKNVDITKPSEYNTEKKVRFRAKARAETLLKNAARIRDRNARAAAALAPAKGTVTSPAEPADNASRDIMKEWGL